MDDTKLSIIDHLEEMRMRMLRSIICVLVLFPVGFVFSQPAIEWLKRTFCTHVDRLYFMQPMELFFTRMKVGFVMALAVSFPYIASHVWRFVSPGLFKHERYYLSRFVFVSTALFALGASFALFLIYPAVLRFAVGMGTEDIAPMLQVRSVVSLAAMLMMGFGVMFQLPIVVFLLAISGIVEVETMRKARPIVVIVVFVVSAVLTPPDIISQCAMGIPSMLLFEISLVVSAVAVKRKRAREAAEEAREHDESSEPGSSGRDGEPPDDDPGPGDDGDAPPGSAAGQDDGSHTPGTMDNDDYQDDYQYEDWDNWHEYVYGQKQEEKGGQKVRSKLRIRARSNTLNTKPRARARRNMLTSRSGKRTHRPGSQP